MSSEDAGRTLVAGLRAHVLTDCARAAQRYRWIWAITAETHAWAGAMVGFASRRCVTRGGSITSHDLDVMTGLEVSAATGLPAYRAEQEVPVARTLCTVLTDTLGALELGRIDPGRAQTLAEGVAGLPDALARKVEKVVLDQLPTTPREGQGSGQGPVGPWDDCSPRAFTARVERAVAAVRTQTEEQVRDEVRARTGISVWVHPGNPAMSTMSITGPTEQVDGIHATVDAGVRGMSPGQLAGRTQGMAAVDLIDDAVHGESRSNSGGTVRRELGVVLNADTLFDDGPAADAPGEVRGTGAPTPVSAPTARVLAGQARAGGAGTCVLLADRYGMLIRLVRVGMMPGTGWTRATLTAATTQALAKQSLAEAVRHETESYQPTREIVEHVRARDPVCTFPGCGVPAGRADLDHTVPHPRGPTSVQNLSPRSRRCHRYKTAGLWHVQARTDAAGLVVAHDWTTLLGTRQVVQVQRLPGHAPGEACARA